MLEMGLKIKESLILTWSSLSDLGRSRNGELLGLHLGSAKPCSNKPPWSLLEGTLGGINMIYVLFTWKIITDVNIMAEVVLLLIMNDIILYQRIQLLQMHWDFFQNVWIFQLWQWLLREVVQKEERCHHRWHTASAWNACDQESKAQSRLISSHSQEDHGTWLAKQNCW